MNHYDIAIIGNGILALSTAYSLSLINPKLNVAIIGKSEMTGAASCASGAMLNYVGEATEETLQNPFSIQKLEISIAASKLWPNWLEHINSFLPEHDKLRYQPGTFVILNGKSGSLDTENYHAIIKAANVYQEPIEEVHPKEIPGLNPLDDCRPLSALYLPNEGSINSNHLLVAMRQVLALNPNINFINENVTQGVVVNHKVTGVQLTNGELVEAEKILLAAGSYNQTILDQIPELSAKIPRLLAGVGVSVVVGQNSHNKIQHVIRTPNRSGACGLHALPRGTDSLYIGATNNIAFGPSLKHKMALSQFLMQCAIDQINQELYSSEILRWHVGNRPVTLDTFPIIGKTSLPNLFILTGTYRDGLQQAPFWGNYMANLLLDLPVEDHLFVPERKLLQTVTSKEDAIAEVVKHYMAGFYEHGMRLARLFPEKSFEQLLYKKFEAIYERLETDVPLKPDILFLFEISDENDQNIAFFRDYFQN